MKKLERLEIIDKIGRELQSRMTYVDIDTYLSGYGIATEHKPSLNSKYIYVKEILGKASDEIVIDIANELKIEHPAISNIPLIKDNDINFWKPGHFKLFISHLASFKATIGALKRELEKYGISSFVAHDDIEPTKQWQEEIEKALFSMDALCAVLMPKFNLSKWTDQEIGVAIGRGLLVIPIRRGMDPYGFIGKYQGFQAEGKKIGEVAEGLFQIISSNQKSKNILINKLSELFLLSNNSDEALQRINSIKKIKSIPKDKIEILHKRIIENKNLRSPKVLIEFNDLTKKFGLIQIKVSDFEKKEKWEYDDLPF